MPTEEIKIQDFSTKIQFYTVTGNVFNKTRKLVLQGTDGVVYVADSQEKMKFRPPDFGVVTQSQKPYY